MTNLPTPAPAGYQATLRLSDALELRAQTVLHAETGAPIGIDLRLFRRLSTELAAGAFAPTGAGLRVPVDRVPELVRALESLAATASASRG